MSWSPLEVARRVPLTIGGRTSKISFAILAYFIVKAWSEPIEPVNLSENLTKGADATPPESIALIGADMGNLLKTIWDFICLRFKVNLPYYTICQL